MVCNNDRASLKTVNADTSTTSLSSTTQRGELRIGDRVIVSSSQGSKTGVIRYQGPAEFAAGEWCGVELDEPIGKNDGSVNDKRCASSSSNLGTLIQEKKKKKEYHKFASYLPSFKAILRLSIVSRKTV